MGLHNRPTQTLPVIQEIAPSKIFCNAIVEQPPVDASTIKGAGIWLVHKELRVVWMNETMEGIYGPLEKARNRHCYEAFRGRSTKCPDCLPTQAFESGNIVSGYVSRTTADQIQRYYQLVEAPLLDSNNEVSNVLEIVMDVTEKTRMEHALRESEREYRALFEHAGTAVAVTNLSGKITRVNEAFEQLSGYTKQEIENNFHYLDFVHPKDRERIAKSVEERGDSLDPVTNVLDFIFKNRKGEERFVQLNLSPMRGGQRIVSMIDLTDKWKLEREIQNREQFLANILRHSMDAIVATDLKDMIRSWNVGAEAMFGFKAKDIIGRPFLSLFTPEFRKSRRMKELAVHFHEQGFLKNFVVNTLTKDRKKLVVDITRTVIRDGAGREIGSSAILRDVTEKLRMDQRLIQQEKMTAMGDLSASLAHEIKNPLNSMVINMEVLKGHLSDLPQEKRRELERYVDILSSETGRLDKVMRNFLDFAKPMEMRFEKVHLDQVAAQVAQLVAPQAERSRIRIRLKPEADLPDVEGSLDFIKQILLNLMLNSIQAMPKGGKLTIITRKGPDGVEVCVEDTGVGIPRQNTNKIFDLYYSTKEKGSGLGLPLVKRLVSAMGGTVRIESRVNYGTKFFIQFPSI